MRRICPYQHCTVALWLVTGRIKRAIAGLYSFEAMILISLFARHREIIGDTLDDQRIAPWSENRVISIASNFIHGGVFLDRAHAVANGDVTDDPRVFGRRDQRFPRARESHRTNDFRNDSNFSTVRRVGKRVATIDDEAYLPIR